ncbi:uncharacterized protein LOC126739959 [Anthonomus grandis grandis]|uniref:uncharacterized protein LOC126739959 n=1 Tax=Anthonomus grandis grandis TaxID=2921223 RepID=UPI0021659ADE|nr:uncharacterized protein LOC126739959 [Anthonomus grandis grandis]
MTRRMLFTFVRESKGVNITEKCKNLEGYILNFGPFSDEGEIKVKREIRRLKSEIVSKWKKLHAIWDKFEKNNKGWLNGIISLPKPLSSSSQRVGRPKTKFYDSSERTKRRKTETLRRDNDLEELTFATQVKLANEGKRDASLVLNEITSTPKRATAYKKAFSASKSKEKVQLTPQQALSMFIEVDLSKGQYEIIRSYNPSMYPCYSKIQEVKKECYPDKESITVTETLADIKLQNLMDHTVSRLVDRSLRSS